jgi:hypothetical protein
MEEASKSGVSDLMMLAVKRPRPPEDARQEDGEDAQHGGPLARGDRVRAQQQGDSRYPHDDTDDQRRCGLPSSRPDPVKDHHHQGRRSQDERSDARLDGLLRPGHDCVAPKEEEGADYRLLPPLASGRPRRTPELEEPENQGPGDGKPHARHQERRHCRNSHANTEIGAPPDQVDGRESQDDAGP